MKICPLCEKPHNNEITNMFTLNIQLILQVFHCFRCGASGHFKQFIYQLAGVSKPQQNDSKFRDNEELN